MLNSIRRRRFNKAIPSWDGFRVYRLGGKYISTDKIIHRWLGRWGHPIGSRAMDVARTLICQCQGLTASTSRVTDEILDLLPGGVQQQLQLDRDRSSNEAACPLTSAAVRSPSSLLLSPFKGQTSTNSPWELEPLEGVEITIRNASGSLPVIGQFSLGEGGSPSTSISIQRAVANAVEIQSEKWSDWC